MEEASNYRTRLGVKVATYTTFSSRFGPGKVHEYYYDIEQKEWRVWCVPAHRGDPHGRRTDRDLEVTCKKCLTRKR